VFRYFYILERPKTVNKSLASSNIMRSAHKTNRHTTDDTSPIRFAKVPMRLERSELSHNGV